MDTLLRKARQINSILHRKNIQKLNFDQTAAVIAQVLSANCFLTDTDGVILAAKDADFECNEGMVAVGSKLPVTFNAMLMEHSQSRIINHQGTDCVFCDDVACSKHDRSMVVAPIISGGQRLGTLLLVKYSSVQTEEELILGECSAAVIGLEMVHGQINKIEKQVRRRAAVEQAFSSLSHSESEAIVHILDQFKGGEGVFVATRIAREIGYTQSVIVNALRKLESAGIVEARSLGVKGTYVKVLNNHLMDRMPAV